MEMREEVKNLFKYLLKVKEMNEKIARNVSDYEKVYFEADLVSTPGCTVSRDNSKAWWLKVTKKAREVYDSLFKIYMDMKKSSEEVEIVWGHGMLGLRGGGSKIMHPVFVTRMELNYDEGEQFFTLSPVEGTHLEVGFLSVVADDAKEELLEEVRQEVRKNCPDPRKFENITRYLSEMLLYLDGDEEGLEGQKTVMAKDKVKLKEVPRFFNAPVVMVRRKGSDVWKQELKDIIDKVDRGFKIPMSVQALVNSKEIEQMDGDKAQWQELSREVLFPLPSNEEQREIVQRLSDNYGVVVEGPPGTGKSHTIANLICHLMAHNKRVLVTSQSDRPLRVLADMIPEEIRGLCVSVLGSDSACLAQMDEGVRQIVDNLCMNKEQLKEEIRAGIERLRQCKDKQKDLMKKYKQLEMVQQSSMNYGGRFYTLMEISRWVKMHEGEYSYIDDDIAMDSIQPLTNSQFERLKEILGFIDKYDLEKINKIGVMLDNLPEYEEIYNKLHRYEELKEKQPQLMEKLKNWDFPKSSRSNLDRVIALCHEAEQNMGLLEQEDFAGVLKIYKSSRTAREAFREVSRRCNACLMEISRLASELSIHSVEIPQDLGINYLREQFDVVYDYMLGKKSLGKFFVAIHKEQVATVMRCRVDGRRLESFDDMVVMRLYLEKADRERNVLFAWNNIMKGYGGKPLDELDDCSMAKLVEYVRCLDMLVNWNQDVKNEIIASLRDVRLPENLNWHASKTYGEMAQVLEGMKQLDELENLYAYFKVLRQMVYSTGVMDDLYEALKANDVNMLRNCFDEIERLRIRKYDVVQLNKLMARLEKPCPKFAARLVNGGDTSSMAGFDKAWKWRQWNTLIRKVNAVNTEFLMKELKGAMELEGQLMKEITAKKTWLARVSSISEEEKRSLMSWATAMKRIGKGTGKYVSEYRNTAQKEMEKCRRMMPVWIMPLNKVIENFKYSNDMFDVIIFDESSQSDVFSICALMRAKKAVIVGDDKQISPESVGVDQVSVKALIRRYLGNIPESQWFDLQTSLYDTAMRVFPNRLMLKEHFRSVPEIVQYSNTFHYDNRMIPLRYPFNREVLNPPVAAVKVKDAVREDNRQVNVKEAQELVKKVVECCRNEAYKGMTMGVISLLGNAQSDLILGMLKEQLGEKELIKRKLVCGDAYSFQGDERDVMFLSMVIGNNVKFTALTKDVDKRRFNVAASRARNQMWLFHSVDLCDLSPQCARHSLLKYFEDYKKFSPCLENTGNIFRSELQKELYKKLREEGYDVRIGSRIHQEYDVDLLVEGDRSRVAVICEGDGMKKDRDFERELMNQLTLERMGWTMLRVSGCEYYYNPEIAMGRILKQISSANVNRRRAVKKASAMV